MADLMRILIRVLLFSVLLLGTPLLGIWLAGKPVAAYLAFPPRTGQVGHASFSWNVFVVDSLLALAFFTWMLCLLIPRRRQEKESAHGHETRAFPAWGWMSLAELILFWWLAWTRQPWFAFFEPHTFTPLWLGYIVFINAVTWKRTGRSLLTHRTGYFLSLFPVSALFWWYFEFLNRFIENWHYVGIEAFGPFRYALHATLAFSTVLPAVISTREWLASWSRLGQGGCRPRWSIRHPRLLAGLVLVLSGVGLLGLGVRPDVLYPLVWVAPLLLIVSLQVLTGSPTLLDRTGDPWRLIALSMLAALLCGFLWEMWNYYSQAKWVYTVPFVQRFHLFEMPLLGYTGYLPFGIECAVVADLVDRALEKKDGQVLESR
ncbi:MAG: hypothetical protein D6721_04195 [Gammaproteobacteria bacterium]|nr:MAG: hypothetical protein D6721_04195 [Gammaproteobacteria bacterium]